MSLITVSGEIISQALNDNFSYLNQKLNQMVYNVKDDAYGAIGDGITDDTIAIQAAITAANSVGGGIIFFPVGTFIINNVNITCDLIIMGCGESSILKHKANATGYMIKLNANGITVEILQATLDGNNANQTIPNSKPLIFSQQAGNSLTDPTHLKVHDVFFKDISYGGIYFYGDSSTATLEKLEVYQCKFIGGKESTSTFNPRFIGVLDGADVDVHNNYFDFGSDPIASPMPALWISGTQTAIVATNRVKFTNNIVKRCGRNIAGSGIGAVDCYLWGEYVNISNNTFIDCYVSPIRCKANSKNLIIMGNHINKVYDLDLTGYNGIHMTPLTAGSVQSNIIIADNIIEDVDNGSGIYIDSASGQVYDKVIIESNIIDTCAVNGIYCDYVSHLVVKTNEIKNITLIGIIVQNANHFIISNNILDTITTQGIAFNGITDHGKIENNMLISVSTNGIQNTGDSTTAKIYCNDNILSSITSNAFALENVAVAILNGNIVESASTSYRVGTNTDVIIQNGYNTGVSTNVNTTGSITNYTENDNSWNRKISFSNAAPVSGTYNRGDIVWNTLPTAGGTVGFICVTAGSPGTWKTFGSITV